MGEKMEKILREELEKEQKKEYKDLVKNTKPKTPYLKNICNAFWIGGLICLISEVLFLILQNFGLADKEASIWALIIIIFFGAFLTGLGVYDKIGRTAGAGSIVPISGFANSIVSSAMEWRREGFISGLAAKIFTVAGPVITYGIGGSVLLGIIKYICMVMGGEI